MNLVEGEIYTLYFEWELKSQPLRRPVEYGQSHPLDFKTKLPQLPHRFCFDASLSRAYITIIEHARPVPFPRLENNPTPNGFVHFAWSECQATGDPYLYGFSNGKPRSGQLSLWRFRHLACKIGGRISRFRQRRGSTPNQYV